MAKRKQILRLGPGNDICLIGISCHLKSYRLSFAMDKSLGLSFSRIEDFIVQGNTNGMLGYPFLMVEDDDLKNQFCLVGNHHPQGKLVPALGQVDFFLMASNPMEQNILNGMIKKIRGIPQVLAAYQIDPAGTRDIDLLLEEMELHLLMANRSRAV